MDISTKISANLGNVENVETSKARMTFNTALHSKFKFKGKLLVRLRLLASKL